MYQTVEATYDGTVLLPDEPITLEANTRVRIQIEALPEKQQSESREQLAQEMAEILDGLRKPQQEEKPMSGAEAIAYWKANNLLGSYGDPKIDSVELARQLRQEAERRSGSDA